MSHPRSVYALTLLLALSLATSGWLWTRHQSLTRQNLNALGEVSGALHGYVAEAINILESPPANRSLRVAAQDLNALRHFLPTVAALDPAHAAAWRRLSADLSYAIKELGDLDGRGTTQPGDQARLEAIRELLMALQSAFPQVLATGANPDVRFDDDAVTAAVEAMDRYMSGRQ